jgi:hypothetical protein
MFKSTKVTEKSTKENTCLYFTRFWRILFWIGYVLNTWNHTVCFLCLRQFLNNIVNLRSRKTALSLNSTTPQHYSATIYWRYSVVV